MQEALHLRSQAWQLRHFDLSMTGRNIANLEKKLRKVNGLLYFTDGVGIYPEKEPSYKTAFIFNRDDCISPHVPPWAIRAVLTTDNIRLLRKAEEE